jgi:alpha-L-fucosidase
MKLKTIAYKRVMIAMLGACWIAGTALTGMAQDEGAAPASQPAARAGRGGGGRGGGGGGRGGLTADAVAKGATHKPDIPPGPFQPNWDSLRANWKPPEWFRDAKFGIFMHWGLYAVPAHGNEWYVSRMYTGNNVAWQTEHFGPISKFGYKDFIPLFTAAKYNPDDWVTLFKKAGAKYIMPTAEHHDGFALWDSALTKWDAKDMGPHRDLIGDMAAAARKQGLKFGVSSHRWEHYGFVNAGTDQSADTYDPQYNDFYWTLNRQDPARAEEFVADWIARQCELIDKYQVDLLYWDNGNNGRDADPAKLKVAAYYYNRAREWGKEVGINTKQQSMLAGGLRDYERGRAVDTQDLPWQEDTAMGHNSWGYTETPKLILRNAGEMVREMVDCVSKNGNYLLNISPRADGTIPDDQQMKLLEIGEWLEQNGEAIYGTRPWGKNWGEGPTDQGEANGARGLTDGMLKTYTSRDMRFTTKGDTLYAIIFAYPTVAENRETVISSLAKSKNIQGTVTNVTVLGPIQPGRITWSMQDDGLHVTQPTYKPNDLAWVVKIEGLKLN